MIGVLQNGRKTKRKNTDSFLCQLLVCLFVFENKTLPLQKKNLLQTPSRPLPTLY
jgi:hypothetical protein